MKLREAQKEITKLQKAIIAQDKLYRKVEKETFLETINWLAEIYKIILPRISKEDLLKRFLKRDEEDYCPCCGREYFDY